MEVEADVEICCNQYQCSSTRSPGRLDLGLNTANWARTFITVNTFGMRLLWILQARLLQVALHVADESAWDSDHQV